MSSSALRLTLALALIIPTLLFALSGRTTHAELDRGDHSPDTTPSTLVDPRQVNERSSSSNCWEMAAHHYRVPASLLYAIGTVESSHNPAARAQAANGTYSIGLMQINSAWFPKLARLGIDEHMVSQPCVNIQIGAWILRQEIERYGPTWHAIGAYYAGPYDQKTFHWKVKHYQSYSTKVMREWDRIHRKEGKKQPAG